MCRIAAATVSDKDPLPHVICFRCANQLDVLNEFKEAARKSETLLFQFLAYARQVTGSSQNTFPVVYSTLPHQPDHEVASSPPTANLFCLDTGTYQWNGKEKLIIKNPTLSAFLLLQICLLFLCDFFM
ncbi:uncharacterized protein LOC116172670 isoform X2 [Photinus pyralis]|uniref:uncharacterized protein LOC116172670 isoform X2 n=1 Tax=Photinus pyralis TaxID=7054 RepID=UPI0012670B1B|nr:uncharacterized protein LOC116172670 isoform X2 [Photinus pyralis]